MKPKTIYSSGKLSRVCELKQQGKTLSTPTYFPAISSYGIKLPPSYLIYLLSNFSYPRVLVSAYDIFHSKGPEKKALYSALKKYDKLVRRRNQGFLFLDSGIYESSWYNDPSWGIATYKDLVSKVKFDFYSSLDILPKGKGKKSLKKFQTQTFSNIVESRNLTNKGELVAILHGIHPDHLLLMVTEFVATQHDLCNIIAVPERDCGEGILEKAQTIMAIRKALDKSDSPKLLHLLGCGNPLSVLLYSFCGVDFFDSLDWYEHLAEPNTLAINDFYQLDLLDCKCKACDRHAKGEYTDRALLHNLFFYQKFMENIRSMIRDNEILSFLSDHVDPKFLGKINGLL